MNLDHLRYFETIARCEHYGRAAEQLHVSQPNLTYAVSQLERELGVPLFEKSGRNVRMTRYGKSFLRSVTQALQTLDGSVRALQELGQGGGLVLLGGIRKLASQTVPELMRRFLEQPGSENIRFELHTGSGFSGDLLKAVEDERLDMAFVSHPGDPTVFECVPFRRSPFVLVTPKDHPLAQRGSVTLRETLPYPYVCFSRKGGLRPVIDELFGEIDAVPQIAYETEEDTVVAGMAAAGFGIAVVPDHPILQCLDVAVLPITEPDASRTAYLCRKKLTDRPLAADRFFRFCVGELRSLSQ